MFGLRDICRVYLILDFINKNVICGKVVVLKKFEVCKLVYIYIERKVFIAFWWKIVRGEFFDSIFSYFYFEFLEKDDFVWKGRFFCCFLDNRWLEGIRGIN